MDKRVLHCGFFQIKWTVAGVVVWVIMSKIQSEGLETYQRSQERWSGWAKPSSRFSGMAQAGLWGLLLAASTFPGQCKYAERGLGCEFMAKDGDRLQSSGQHAAGCLLGHRAERTSMSFNPWFPKGWGSISKCCKWALISQLVVHTFAFTALYCW